MISMSKQRNRKEPVAATRLQKSKLKKPKGQEAPSPAIAA